MELCEGLNNSNDRYSTGTGRGEHHLCSFDLRDSTEFVKVHHDSVFQSAVVFIGNSKDLTIHLLNDQRYHKVLGGIFLGEHDKNGGFRATELLGIDGSIKAEDLFQLGVEESVQSGQCRGHNR